jgi:hypothetical protein
MNVLDIVREYLMKHGHYGLFNQANGCTCFVEDIGKCASLYQDCQVTIPDITTPDPHDDSTKVLPLSSEEPVWAICRRTHTQACHICEDASCGDNSNPALRKKR